MAGVRNNGAIGAPLSGAPHRRLYCCVAYFFCAAQLCCAAPPLRRACSGLAGVARARACGAKITRGIIALAPRSAAASSARSWRLASIVAQRHMSENVISVAMAAA
jgi:hypothetical protein